MAENNWVEFLSFEVLGRPQQRGSKRLIKTRAGKTVMMDVNVKSVAWMDAVRSAADAAWGKPLVTTPLALSAVFRFARTKSHYCTGRNAGKLKASAPSIHAQSPDLAKLVRSLEDGITGAIWRDDRQVVEYLSPMRREWTEAAEGVTVTIWGLTGLEK